MIATSRDLRQNAAVESWRQAGGKGLVVAATGFGKSKVVCTVIDKLRVAKPSARVLWLTPTQKLRDQDVPQEILKWSPNSVGYIDIQCYQGLNEDNHDIDSYDLVILDEAHHVTERVQEVLQQIGYKYILGVTATPPKDAVKQGILKNMGCYPTVCTVTLSEAIRNKWVADFQVHVEYVRMDAAEEMAYLEQDAMCVAAVERSGSRTSVLAKAAYGKRARYVYGCRSKIFQTIRSAQLAEGRTIVFAGSVDAAIEIAEALNGEAYYGAVKKKQRASIIERFEAGEFRHLVCVKALDEGANIKDVDSIVLGQCSSSELQAIQRVGRGIRYREGHTCVVLVVCLRDTCDERWVRVATKALR